jgi:small subunit ribosomal protein S16
MGQRRRSPPGVHAARQHICWEKTTPVAVKIKLKRLGKIRAPYYRIIVADARTKRDGRAIEEIGKYHPKAEPSFIEVDSERAQHWLSVGAQPTDPVRKILEITGDWQKFKGLPGTEGTLRTAAPREDRKEIFAAAVKETLGDAAPKSKARSGAAKDGDSASRGGKAAAKDSAPGKADKPARAKTDEAAGEARGRDKGKGTPAKGTPAKNGTAKDGTPKDGAAKDRAPKDGTPKDGTPKDGTPKDGTPKDGAAKRGDAAGAEAAGAEAAGAEAAGADAAGADAAGADAAAAAQTADAESASGD